MPSKFGIELTGAKNFFFDRLIVEDAFDKATIEGLSKLGALLRVVARRSLRRRKKVSSPGQPPSVHAPGSYNLKRILYQYSPADRSVIVGPVRFSTPVNVASLMEHGGPTSSHGRRRRGTARYPRRPFMKPVMDKKVDEGPNLLRDALERQQVRKARKR